MSDYQSTIGAFLKTITEDDDKAAKPAKTSRIPAGAKKIGSAKTGPVEAPAVEPEPVKPVASIATPKVKAAQKAVNKALSTAVAKIAKTAKPKADPKKVEAGKTKPAKPVKVPAPKAPAKPAKKSAAKVAPLPAAGAKSKKPKAAKAPAVEPVKYAGFVSKEVYDLFHRAYEHFNKELFGGRLPGTVIINMMRKKKARGYYVFERFESKHGRADEIALNPMHFNGRTTAQVLSTLVHEMTHLEQYHFGKPSRGGYHNEEWATYMDRVGLAPSNTGEEGGKRTGQQMTHYITPGGVYEKAIDSLFGGDVPELWADGSPATGGSGGSTARNKVKYSCACGCNVWGKPGLSILCGECEEYFVAAS